MTDEPRKVETAGNVSAVGRITMFKKLPEQHEFYSLVGRIASEWSHLEHVVDRTIWFMLGVEPRFGACLTSQYPALGQRCNAECSLGIAKGLKKTDVKPFKKLRGDSYKAANWRARWVHDAWLVDLGKDKPAQFRAMPEVDFRFGAQEISRPEMEKTLAAIRHLQTSAQEAQKSVLTAFAALP